jgi:hypothetical protein
MQFCFKCSHRESNILLMKPKELANVLIKILGLSVLVHAIPTFIAEIYPMLTAVGSVIGSGHTYLFFSIISALFNGVVQLLIGGLLIVLSRPVTALLFRNEAE